MPFMPYLKMQPEKRMGDGLVDRLEPLSQTLFSAHIIAEVLPCIWKKDPVEGESRLKELCQLTSEALTEMDALLDDLWETKRDRNRVLTRTNEEN